MHEFDACFVFSVLRIRLNGRGFDRLSLVPVITFLLPLACDDCLQKVLMFAAKKSFSLLELDYCVWLSDRL